ncbi:hypothetical protein V1478_003795 [Vespula squamosa]|uniref:Secreted protein n=1 Tax=Vespula squamosa TaxID=30214 RepID=A0ABD2BMU2_VESSQ
MRLVIFAGLRLLRQVLLCQGKKSAVRRHSRMPSSRRGVPPLHRVGAKATLSLIGCECSIMMDGRYNGEQFRVL